MSLGCQDTFGFDSIEIWNDIWFHPIKFAYQGRLSLEADIAGSLALDPPPPVGRLFQRCQRKRVVALVVVHGVEPAGQEALPHGAPHPQPGPRLAPRGQGGEMTERC